MTRENDKRTEIGNRIRGLRKEKGLKISQLANEANISAGYLSDVERGESAISSEKLAEVAKVLGASTDYLISGESSPYTVEAREINVPTALSEAAITLELPYRKTMQLLEGRRSLIARRSQGDDQEWGQDEWISFYRTVKDYLD